MTAYATNGLAPLMAGGKFEQRDPVSEGRVWLRRWNSSALQFRICESRCHQRDRCLRIKRSSDTVRDQTRASRLRECRLFRQDANHCRSSGLGLCVHDIVDGNCDTLTRPEGFTLPKLASGSHHRGFLVDEEGLAQDELFWRHLFHNALNISWKKSRGR